MTGVTERPAGVVKTHAPGLLLAALIALLALFLGRLAPVIGGPVFGIVLGIVLRQFWVPRALFSRGLRVAEKRVLQWSVIALGFGLSLGQVFTVGLESLSVLLLTMASAFAAGWLLARWLGVEEKLKILISVGTAICGGSAIAAVTPILRPEEHDVAFAISTIFLFNVIAVLVFPPLGHWMGLSDAGFGLWAGTAINDTSSVVAAGYSYSQAAGDHATMVKLTRTTMIIPICIVLAVWMAWRERRRHGTAGGIDVRALVAVFPRFILWFLLASALRTAGWIPVQWLPWLQTLAQFLIVVALTAIGLSTDLRRIVASGPRPIMLGLGVWLAVALSSLLIQGLTGRL